MDMTWRIAAAALTRRNLDKINILSRAGWQDTALRKHAPDP